SLCVPSNTIEGIREFFSKTFYSHQHGIDEVMVKVERTLSYLCENGLVGGEGTLSATPIGKRISELYIDPMSGITLRNALRDEMSVFGMLHAICNTPDMPNYYLRKGDAERYDPVACECHDEFLVEVPDSWYEPDDYEFFLSEVKTASVLMDWISEIPERTICETYDIGPGDLTRTKENAVWLSYAFKEIARTMGIPYNELSRLHQRLQHGIGTELLDLTKVKGIGRVRARKLYNLNIRNVGDLRRAPLERLERILGKKTALNVKQEAGVIVPERKERDAEKDSTLV
ncbi:MAG TPA: helix-hairpin-helix domain-containing protein, partial [Candidatus Methanofastidiosa archaeon]|nr:helix-hairpin-helix domain-containing protein [Candidatus Methanofastidiosa archaeon]